MRHHKSLNKANDAVFFSTKKNNSSVRKMGTRCAVVVDVGSKRSSTSNIEKQKESSGRANENFCEIFHNEWGAQAVNYCELQSTLPIMQTGTGNLPSVTARWLCYSCVHHLAASGVTLLFSLLLSHAKTATTMDNN